MGKKFEAAKAKVNSEKTYELVEGFNLVPETKCAKFDETVDLAIKLGVDAKSGEQVVRGVVALPHGPGKSPRVAVFARGEVHHSDSTEVLGVVSRNGAYAEQVVVEPKRRRLLAVGIAVDCLVGSRG